MDNILKREFFEIIYTNMMNIFPEQKKIPKEEQLKNWVDSMDSEETLYYYAFSIASVDNDINESERAFLDELAEALDIQPMDRNSIERRFNEEWLDGFEPSLK